MSTRELDVTNPFDMENDSVVYTGYVPKSPEDFPFVVNQDLVDQDAQNEGETAPKTAWNSTRVSLIVLIAAVVLFVVTFPFSFSNADCKLSLCQKLDKSSRVDSRYKNPSFDFVAPLKYAWTALAISFLGVAVLAAYSFSLLKIDSLTTNMKRLTALIQQGTRAFLLQELKYFLIVVVSIFILTGVASWWTSAACFLFGVVFSAILGWACSAIATRGSLRTASVAQDSIPECLVTALRTASIVGMAIVSFGLSGLAICYLIFQDIHSSAGFALGVCCTALFARLAGGMYKKTADVGGDCMREMQFLDDDMRNPASIANSVGDVVGNICGMAIDFMSSQVIAIVATAVIGTSLPYFYDNSYAMCVFNHLNLDKTCVAYEMPGVKASFAASVCRFESFHRSYPNLQTWQSNSLFVAVPFLFGLVGVLTSAICTVRFLVPKQITEIPANCESKVKLLKSTMMLLRLNVLVSAFLTIICAAAISWGLFGGRSEFMRAHTGNFERYELQPLTTDNADTRCRPLQAQDGIGKTGLPDLRLELGPYRPMNSFGIEYAVASQVPWRLFLCVAAGCVLGILLGAITEYATCSMSPSARQMASNGERGRLAVIMGSLGMSMVSTMAPVIVIITAIAISFKLFGPYGVGLCAIGLLSSVGSISTFEALSPIIDNAKIVTQGVNVPRITWRTADVVSVIGTTTNAVTRGISSGSAVLSSFALVAVLVQSSGLVPSSRQLAGTVTVQPSRHITDFEDISVLNVYVLVSTILGVLLPCLFSGIVLLSGNRSFQVMLGVIGKHFKNSPISLWEAPRTQDNYRRLMRLSCTAGVLHMFIPMLIALMSPLIVGFGFGQRALIGMVIGAISSCFMLSITLGIAGGTLENLRKYVNGGYCGTQKMNSMEWSLATGTGDMFGKGLKDCCATSLNALMKMICSLGVIAIPVMSPAIQRGWIGIILLLGTLVIVALVTFITEKWGRSQAPHSGSEIDGEHMPESQKHRLNRQYISPFYEEGPQIEKDMFSPTSEFARWKEVEAVRYVDEDSCGHWSPISPENYHYRTPEYDGNNRLETNIEIENDGEAEAIDGVDLIKVSL